eukprot:g16423.t1
MPAKGGAFFGFAIIVAAALITWGIIALVDVANDSSDDGGSSSRSIESSEVQDAINNASPGDTIRIPEGTHEIGLTTTVSGTEENPITLTCESDNRDDCVLKGNGNARVLEILHSWWIIEEFTIDGRESNDEYKEQLIFVQGSGEPEEVNGVETALTGVTIRGMNLRNAGRECIRIRYFVTNSVVDENLIGPCGIEDFVLENNGNSNGEGVYIGTALTQIDDKGDDYPQVDQCSGIVVMNNRIETQGSEGVDIKEGSYNNIIYRNEISGQMDVDAGGVSLRGDNNVVYYNRMVDGEGTCIRIGGDDYDSIDYGRNNEVYVNEFDSCRYSAIKVNEAPQTICENVVIEADSEDQLDGYATVRGDSAFEFPESEITGDCNPEPDVIADHIRVGDRFDFAIIGSGSTVVVLDDDSAEEEDDAVEDSVEEVDQYVGTDTTVYRGCYFINSNFPGAMFDVLVYDGDANLSVSKCVLACVGQSLEFAAIQDGTQCWCGDQDDFDQYGSGMCNSACTDTGAEDIYCGGEVSFDLFQIYGDGGVDDDQGDDGGAGAGTVTTPTPVVVVTDDEEEEYSNVVIIDQDQEEEEEEEPVAIEEEDDDDQAVIVPAGDLEGCYQDSDTDPILTFEYEDEETLTPASCIEHCRGEGQGLAGVQAGKQCWCGSSSADYKKYGTSETCNISCSGDPSETCGGVNASNIWTVD